MSLLDLVKSTKFVVVDGKGPCLIGRILMRRLGLIEDVNAVSATAISMQQEFPELFSEGLGCFKDRQFSLEVDPLVPPRFFKARNPTYTVRAKIDAEIDRLLKGGIISPVTNVGKTNGKVES